MSYDFKIPKLCSHIIVDEISQLNNQNYNTIGFARRPSSYLVTLKVDGEIVPPGGLYSKAQILLGKAEPYRIVAGKNDLILYRGKSGTQTIKLPPGNAVSAKSLALYLSSYITDIDIKAENYRITFSTPTPFKGSAFSFPDPKWTDKTASLISTSRILAAYKTLGINPGRTAIGELIVPGYIVTLNPDSFVEEYIIRFNTPIRNRNPVILLTYNTLAAFCGRCLGTRVEYDYTVSGQSYKTVKNTDLLIQEFNKFLFTVKGSHWKWPWIGSTLLDRVGGKADTASQLASSFITLDINNAFNTYQNIKRQQDNNFPDQNVTDEEYPYRLGDVNVSSLPNDPTTYYAQYTIIPRSRQPVQVEDILPLPGNYQLTSDSSGLMSAAASGFQLVG
jgi:hypothetical protein